MAESKIGFFQKEAGTGEVKEKWVDLGDDRSPYSSFSRKSIRQQLLPCDRMSLWEDDKGSNLCFVVLDGKGDEDMLDGFFSFMRSLMRERSFTQRRFRGKRKGRYKGRLYKAQKQKGYWLDESHTMTDEVSCDGGV